MSMQMRFLRERFSREGRLRVNVLLYDIYYDDWWRSLEHRRLLPLEVALPALAVVEVHPPELLVPDHVLPQPELGRVDPQHPSAVAAHLV